MRKGKVVINFESNDLGDCKWDIQQESDDHLDNKNLASLFEHILADLIAEQFE